MTKIYGYIRVSSKDQNVDRQLIAFEPYHIKPQNIFVDKKSGKNFDRPEWGRLIRRLKSGDLLVVKSIDRLGRNYNEILCEWRLITKELHADITVIDMPLLDTRSSSNDLTGIFISDLVLQILSYVAQTERDFIHQRQAEGIVAAKQRGVRFGRRAMQLPLNFLEVYEEWQSGKISARKAAKYLGVTHPTFRKWVEKIEVNENRN